MEAKMSAIGGSALGGKVAIISDIHNNITNLKKVLNYCRNNNVQKIVCCGDLASMETLDFLNDNFSGKIFYCFGNMDDGQLKNYDFEAKYKNTWIFRNFGELIISSNKVEPFSGQGSTLNKKIAFVHYPEKAEELCQTGKYDFVFYGHTHKPWEETIGKCKTLNPGNVAGEIYPPTFAIWNTGDDRFELIRVHDLS